MAATDFLGAISRGYNRWIDSASQPGPDFKVTPFEPGTVTAPRAILKLATAIAAARRSEANAAAAREAEMAKAALDRDKAQAQIGVDRAQTEWYGRRDQPEPAATVVGELDFDGTVVPFTDPAKYAAAWAAKKRAEAYARTAGTRGGSTSKRYTAAKARLSTLDMDEKMYAEAVTDRLFRPVVDKLLAIASGRNVPMTQQEVASAGLRGQPNQSAAREALGLTGNEDARSQAIAVQSLLGRFRARALARYQWKNRAQRIALNRVIAEEGGIDPSEYGVTTAPNGSTAQPSPGVDPAAPPLPSEVQSYLDSMPE